MPSFIGAGVGFPDLAKVDGGESGWLAGKQADWFGQIPASMAYAARGVDWSAPHPAINKPTEREQLRDEPHYSVLLSLSLSRFLSPFHFSISLPLLRPSSCFSSVVLVSPVRFSSSYLTDMLSTIQHVHAVSPVLLKNERQRVPGIITSRRMLKASCTFSFHALISFFFFFFFFLFSSLFSSFSAASLFNLLKTLTRTGPAISAS